MLSVVAAAFAKAGCQVLGTATSGQAARNLSTEAEIGTRTLANMIWRLDHNRLVLTDQTVVILDEAGMTDDVDLVRLAAHVEAAGAKLICVGDHLQLGPVGPGGALGALVARHPAAVHHLSENRRQHDPSEREALVALRHGDVSEAISFYRGLDRIHAGPSRSDALQGAVDAWSADVAAGRETGLYAWRRANVAELNRLARSWMESSGRLSGPELVCPGGNTYRAGDQVVALMPGPADTLVTSDRAVVESVDPARGTVVVRTSDARCIRLIDEEASAERLGYGYATTVHRSQGATVTRAHLFADGGGRELAYVAMSRARESTHAWVVADDLEQAADDLRRDWSTERTPTWAIDTGLPDPHHLTNDTLAGLAEDERIRMAALAHTRTVIAADALSRIGTSEVAPTLVDARIALEGAQRARDDLAAGSGAYQYTDAGRAVADLAHAKAAWTVAQRKAENSPRWHDRRSSAKQADGWSQREADAQQRWKIHVAPEAIRLDRLIARHEATVERLTALHARQEAAARRLAEQAWELRRTSSRLATGLDRYRNRVDGITRPPTSRFGPARLRQTRVPPPTREYEPSGSPSLGPRM
jgi:hypothetical protein